MRRRRSRLTTPSTIANGVYFNNVLQTYISTLDSQIVVNANTTYEYGAPSEAEITAALLKRIKEVGQSCLECLTIGCACELDVNGDCSRCMRLGLFEIRGQCVMAFSDQESKQRSGLAKLHTAAVQRGLTSLPHPDYCWFGFGVRHQIKVLIAALRKYRIASRNGGELCVGMLRALVCSDTSLGAALSRATRIE